MYYSFQSQPLQAVAASPSGTHVVVASQRDMLQILAVSSTEVRETINLRAGVPRSNAFVVTDVKWAPSYSPNTIATATQSGSIAVWDLGKFGAQKLDRTLSEHTRAINRIMFSPSSPILLLSASHDGTMKLWDLRTKRIAQRTFDAKAEVVRDVNFNPANANHFVAALDNGAIQKWDIRNQSNCAAKWSAHNGPVLTAAYSDDGSCIATGGRDRIIKIWSFNPDASSSSISIATTNAGAVLDKKPILSFQTVAPINNVAWRPGHPLQLASSALSNDYRIHLWDLRRPHLARRQLYVHDGVVSGFLWHNDSTIWSCSKDRCFAVTDITKVGIEPFQLVNTSVAAWNPTGELFFAIDERKRGFLPDMPENKLKAIGMGVDQHQNDQLPPQHPQQQQQQQSLQPQQQQEQHQDQHDQQKQDRYSTHSKSKSHTSMDHLSDVEGRLRFKQGIGHSQTNIEQLGLRSDSEQSMGSMSMARQESKVSTVRSDNDSEYDEDNDDGSILEDHTAAGTAGLEPRDASSSRDAARLSSVSLASLVSNNSNAGIPARHNVGGSVTPKQFIDNDNTHQHGVDSDDSLMQKTSFFSEHHKKADQQGGSSSKQKYHKSSDINSGKPDTAIDQNEVDDTEMNLRDDEYAGGLRGIDYLLRRSRTENNGGDDDYREESANLEDDTVHNTSSPRRNRIQLGSTIDDTRGNRPDSPLSKKGGGNISDSNDSLTKDDTNSHDLASRNMVSGSSQDMQKDTHDKSSVGRTAGKAAAALVNRLSLSKERKELPKNRKDSLLTKAAISGTIPSNTVITVTESEGLPPMRKILKDHRYVMSQQVGLIDTDTFDSYAFAVMAENYKLESGNKFAESCEHNALVANSLGLVQVANTWRIIALILSNYALFRKTSDSETQESTMVDAKSRLEEWERTFSNYTSRVREYLKDFPLADKHAGDMFFAATGHYHYQDTHQGKEKNSRSRKSKSALASALGNKSSEQANVKRSKKNKTTKYNRRKDGSKSQDKESDLKVGDDSMKSRNKTRSTSRSHPDAPSSSLSRALSLQEGKKQDQTDKSTHCHYVGYCKQHSECHGTKSGSVSNSFKKQSRAVSHKHGVTSKNDKMRPSTSSDMDDSDQDSSSYDSMLENMPTVDEDSSDAGNGRVSLTSEKFPPRSIGAAALGSSAFDKKQVFRSVRGRRSHQHGGYGADRSSGIDSDDSDTSLGDGSNVTSGRSRSTKAAHLTRHGYLVETDEEDGVDEEDEDEDEYERDEDEDDEEDDEEDEEGSDSCSQCSTCYAREIMKEETERNDGTNKKIEVDTGASMGMTSNVEPTTNVTEGSRRRRSRRQRSSKSRHGKGADTTTPRTTGNAIDRNDMAPEGEIFVPWFDPFPAVLQVLEHYAQQGDVQMCSTVVAVCMDALQDEETNSLTHTITSGGGSDILRRVPAAEAVRERAQEWIVEYVDLLQRFEQWTSAARVVKAALPCSEAAARAQDFSGVQSACGACGRSRDEDSGGGGGGGVGGVGGEDGGQHGTTMDGGISAGIYGGCRGCGRRFTMCVVCHKPVKGLLVWCAGCGHGGHVQCVERWHSRRALCASGCGHTCDVSTTTKTVAQSVPREECSVITVAIGVDVPRLR